MAGRRPTRNVKIEIRTYSMESINTMRTQVRITSRVYISADKQNKSNS